LSGRTPLKIPRSAATRDLDLARASYSEQRATAGNAPAVSGVGETSTSPAA
jgi:hypothetical protein